MDRQLESCSKPSIVRKNPCLKSTMDKLFEKRSRTGDIKFMVDGEVIHAHRCVLAALSPRYEGQFYGMLPEKGTINVKNISPAAFKEFLQFFYTDEVKLTLGNIEDVLNLAKESFVDELVAECINYLVDLVGLDKIVWCYRLALVYDLKPLEEFCVKHINENIKTVFQSEDFLSCERDMMCRILDLPRLNCNKADVFDACISWARGKCEQHGVDATDTANLRELLGEAIFEIPFCSMNLEEFAAIDRKWAGLLSAQESREIFQAIAVNAMEQSKPRQPKLKCSFNKGPRSRIGLPLLENCRILALCDKTIEVNGLVLCNRIEGDVSIVVGKIISEIREFPKCTTSITDDETVITFDKAIRIPVNERFFVQVQLADFQKSNSNLFGYTVQDKIVQHGVAFEFGKINQTDLNLISHLLFSIVNES